MKAVLTPTRPRSPLSRPLGGRSRHTGPHRVLGGEPHVQVRPNVRQPRRLPDAPRGGDQIEVEIGDDHALGAGVLVLGDDAVVEPERPVESGPRRAPCPSRGWPRRPVSRSCRRGRGDDEELVLEEGAGVGGVADPLRGPAVPGQQQAEDQVEAPWRARCRLTSGNSTSAQIWTATGGRTDLRDEHLVARGRAHRLLLRSEVELWSCRSTRPSTSARTTVFR